MGSMSAASRQRCNLKNVLNIFSEFNLNFSFCSLAFVCESSRGTKVNKFPCLLQTVCGTFAACSRGRQGGCGGCG